MMELILTLIGEFIITPILTAIRAVFEFVFWMACWLVWQLVRGVVWTFRLLTPRQDR